MKIKFFAVTLFAFLLSACSSAANPLSATQVAPPVPRGTPTIFDVQVSAPASASRLADERPNIIVILTDDQPFQTVDYMPTVKNVLAAQGVNFTNGFVTTPLCCPSRVSIMNGQYAHNHQVYTNTPPMGGAVKFKDASSVAVWLNDAGYRTAYYGKYMNGYEDLKPYGYVPPGWDEWGAFLSKNLAGTNDDVGKLQYYFNFSMSENGTPVEYLKNKANFSADVVTEKAVNFINEARDQPFLLFMGYYNPHSPYVAAPRHKDTFRDPSEWIPYRPPDFNEKDVSDKPQYVQALNAFSPEEVDITYKQILRSLLSVDDGVASVLNALDKTGLRQKTIIVYLSDNGLTVGDHRFGFSKNCPYEACVKVPFIVYAPGYYAPRTDSRLVANIDLAPTFAELAGAPIPSSVDGMSLVPLLKDPNASWRDRILLEHWPTEEGIGSTIPEFYSIRTPDWKYTEYSTGERELYDLKNDPYELNNLANQWRYRGIQAELAQQLAELKKQ